MRTQLDAIQATLEGAEAELRRARRTRSLLIGVVVAGATLQTVTLGALVALWAGAPGTPTAALRAEREAWEASIAERMAAWEAMQGASHEVLAEWRAWFEGASAKPASGQTADRGKR